MRPLLQLRQLAVVPPADGSTNAPERAEATLVIRGDMVRFVAIDDVVSLIVALLSDIPYRAPGQDLVVRDIGNRQREIALQTPTETTAVATVRQEVLDKQIVGLLETAVSGLASAGATHIISPLLAVLGSKTATVL